MLIFGLAFINWSTFNKFVLAISYKLSPFLIVYWLGLDSTLTFVCFLVVVLVWGKGFTLSTEEGLEGIVKLAPACILLTSAILLAFAKSLTDIPKFLDIELRVSPFFIL